MAVSIALADDCPLLRQGIQSVLQSQGGFLVVGVAAFGAETVNLIRGVQPDVLVIGLVAPDAPAVAVARQVRTVSPRTRLVLLSTEPGGARMRKALGSQVGSHLSLKGSTPADLIEAVLAAAGKGPFRPPGRSRPAAAADVPGGLRLGLTAREWEVVWLAVQGHTSAEAAPLLHISRRTVESHLANVMRKLGVRNQKELIRYVLQQGFRPEGQ